MNPVQKTGILALGLLLAVAVIGFLLGPNKASAEDVRSDVPVIDIAALPAVEFQPPESRQFWIAAEDFRQQPIQHPLEGGSGRRITDWQERPEPAPEPLQPRPAIDPGLGSVPASATYKVREDDNLVKIAKRELGSGDRYMEIAQLNGLEKPFTVRIGQLLVLPPVESGPVSVWQAGGDATPAEITLPDPAAGAGPREQDPEQQGGWTSYKVSQNETISEVSVAVYGTARLWKLILEANGIDDPRKVRADQTLRIPPRP